MQKVFFPKFSILESCVYVRFPSLQYMFTILISPSSDSICTNSCGNSSRPPIVPFSVIFRSSLTNVAVSALPDTVT